MGNSPVLGLESGSNVMNGGSGHGVYERAEGFRISEQNFDKIDSWVGKASASFVSTFFGTSGSVLDMSIAGTDQGAGVMGMAYNKLQDRVITDVVGFTAASGSAPTGVVRVDVQVQQGAAQPANYSTIFLSNPVKLAVSGSAANGPVSVGSTTFVSGSNMVWPKGTCLKVGADQTANVQAGLSAMRGLTVQVCWRQSGSYGS